MISTKKTRYKTREKLQDKTDWSYGHPNRPKEIPNPGP